MNVEEHVLAEKFAAEKMQTEEQKMSEKLVAFAEVLVYYRHTDDALLPAYWLSAEMEFVKIDNLVDTTVGKFGLAAAVVVAPEKLDSNFDYKTLQKD